ncbi:E3 ubiquitin-protein ligase RGLG2-like protein [Drosera capensis]
MGNGGSSPTERDFGQSSSFSSREVPESGYAAGYEYPYAYQPQRHQQQPVYPPPYQPGYPPQPAYGTSDATYDVLGQPSKPRRLTKNYSRIYDEYTSLDQVTAALARNGLESSNLIIGIDFTKSNEWTGARSYNRKSLHHIGDGLNPYEQAISIIGKTLATFDEDNLIPCYGFGDASTHDQDVFSFYPDERYCNGFEEVLARYREIVPHVRLAGPTSFAPVIEMAMTIVEQSGGQYHVLLIIADGQVTRSVDTEGGQLSPQERKTVDAIVRARKYPLSIVLVGVGDGPWDTMKEFDDNIPDQNFDNFQFVNFTDIMSKSISASRRETEFALAALMEIPTQYKATIELNLLGKRVGASPERFALPPPKTVPSYGSSKPYQSTSFQKSIPPDPYYQSSSSFGAGTAPPLPTGAYHDYHEASFSTGVTAPPAPSSAFDDMLCPVCLTNKKDMAFGCGHQTCCDCGQDLEICPICRRQIEAKIRLF